MLCDRLGRNLLCVQRAEWNISCERNTRQLMQRRAEVPPKRIGLCSPVEVAERPRKSIEVVFRRIVIANGDHAESCLIRFSISASACVSCCLRA
jgi:hypothetical protein